MFACALSGVHESKMRCMYIWQIYGMMVYNAPQDQRTVSIHKDITR